MEIEKLIQQCSDDKNYKNLTLSKFYVEADGGGGFIWGAELEGFERQDGATLTEALVNLREYLPKKFMVLGLKDYPVNPNDIIPDWTERDNPYLFSSVEEAKKFIGEAKNKYYDDEMRQDEVKYLEIVKLI